MILWALVLALPNRLLAQQFIDTTTGSVDESSEFYGMDPNEATTDKAQSIIDKFKEGRLSSNRKTDSRFSSLELHDSNQDGIVDHGNANSGGLEGQLLTLVDGADNGMDSGRLNEIAEEALKSVNKGTCTRGSSADKTYLEGTRTEDGNRIACHSMSGIIVDTGGAHGGDRDFHRTLKLSEEAKEIAERIGQEYGEKALDDIMKLYQETYGDELEGQDKVAAVDLKRSEAAWLEQQKENTYTRQWQLLRAARLAGYDGADERVAGTRGAQFMHELESKLANGASEQELAEMISVESTLEGKALGYKNGWVALDSLSAAEQDAAAEEAKRRLNLDPDSPSVNLSDLSSVSESERREAADNVRQHVSEAPDDDEQERRQKIAGCLDGDTWCHTEDSALIANGENPDSAEAFTAVSGDPGEVFQDTRELIALKMAQMQTTPVNKIRELVTNQDFNESTHPEFFQELDEKITAVQWLEDNDPDNYDLDTMSFRELTGIRKGLNDTFDDSLPGLQDVYRKIGGPVSTGGAAGPTAGAGGNVGPVNNRRTPSSFN